jgi:multiple sugar transport system permease protein
VRRSSFLNIIFIVIILIFVLYPFYAMFIASLKSPQELYNIKANPFCVQKPTLNNYITLLRKTNFLHWFLNSTIVTISTTIISITVSVLAAYALARLNFIGSKVLGVGVFIVYLVPQTLLFVSLSRVINSLNLSNSLWSLIFTYPTFQIPFSTWLLMGYFRSLPREVEEAAEVDGASKLKTLLKIVIPMAFPAIITVTLFCFVLSWGEMIYALTFISESLKQTLSVGTTTELIRGDMFYWGPLMAGGLLSALPVVLAFSFLVDYYVSGLSAGAIK